MACDSSFAESGRDCTVTINLPQRETILIEQKFRLTLRVVTKSWDPLPVPGVAGERGAIAGHPSPIHRSAHPPIGSGGIPIARTAAAGGSVVVGRVPKGLAGGGAAAEQARGQEQRTGEKGE